jgi:NAD+ synthase
MLETLTIALAQTNLQVGNPRANAEAMLEQRARAGSADLIVFPELSLIGYPPEDLVLKPALQSQAKEEIARLQAATQDNGPAMLVGSCWCEEGQLYNAMLLLDRGQCIGITRKHDLPNYGVFDEKRVFAPGPLPGPLNFRGVRLGVPICEDVWRPDVVECLGETGADILITPNGSPFEVGKNDQRLQICLQRVLESGLPLVYLNRMGGQDELVFDGASFVLNANQTLACQLPNWQEALVITHWQRSETGWVCTPTTRVALGDDLSNTYQAMLTGLRDYVGRNRFPGVVLGLSGGIDSALSAAVGVDALGADKVLGVMMPSRYTSAASLEDAAACAQLLGIKLETIPIEPAIAAYTQMLAPSFAGQPNDVTEENLQSRARAMVLMALSNKFGPMVLTTGNKSEMATGYATLYGDMCGGYNVLKDVYKTGVFALARWRNSATPAPGLGHAGLVMPQRVIDKPPTAELRANQKDQDSLPPYEILDAILKGLVELEQSAADLVAQGYNRATILRVEHLLHIAEYKRCQAPPGVKISPRNFGRDRRYPISHGFRSTLAP